MALNIHRRSAAGICFLAVATLPAIALPISSSASSTTRTAAPEPDAADYVELRVPVAAELDDLDAAAAQAADEVQVSISFPSGSREFTTGTAIEPSELGEATSSGILRDALTDTLPPEPSSKETIENFDDALSAPGGLTIASVWVSEPDLPVFQDAGFARAEAQALVATEDAVARARCSKRTFQPYSDSILAYRRYSDRAERRYGYIGLKLHWNGRRLAKLQCKSNVTYEHDFKTNNYDDKQIFDGGIASFTSSMPNAYKDTTFLDGGDELYYTVGTSDAQDLRKSREYYIGISTALGNNRRDTAALQAQRGERRPSSCSSTFCIFSVGNTKNIRAAWKLKLPIKPTNV